MKIRFIGDIHGVFSAYNKALDGAELSVQVGDFGMGFVSDEEVAQIAAWHEATGLRHRFIRGNHDRLDTCKQMPGYIPDGTVEGRVMYIGGAHSPSHYKAVPMVNWWPDEEVTWDAFDKIRADYMKAKPDVLVVHDFPDECARMMFDWYEGKNESRQRAMLQELFDIRRPDLIIGGHWHARRDMEVFGTRCICLGIYDYIDVEL